MAEQNNYRAGGRPNHRGSRPQGSRDFKRDDRRPGSHDAKRGSYRGNNRDDRNDRKGGKVSDFRDKRSTRGKGGFDGHNDRRNSDGRRADGPKGGRKFEDRRGPRKFNDNRGSRKDLDKRQAKPKRVEGLESKDADAAIQSQEKTGYAGELHGRRRPNNAESLVTPARLTAYKLVRMVRDESMSVHEAGRRILSAAKLSAEDKAFAQLLATGVISTYGTLNLILNRILRDPRDVSPEVRDALCISVYEIVFLKKAPHAAVDQGVELVRALAPRASKLANFVLRRANEFRKALPAFGEGTLEDDALLAGFPAWMVRTLTETRGENWTRAFLAHSGEQTQAKSVVPIWFTFNENRVDGAAALKSLVERGIDVAPEASALSYQPSVFRLKNRKDVSDPLFSGLLKEGALVVSDYSAQAIAALSVSSNKPERFLEIGAGRGTKTLMIQSAAKHAFGSQMELCAVELSPHKARILEERCARSHTNAEVVVADATNLSELECTFDAILLDAPCSGSGTTRRHPEIKWRITEDEVKAISRLEFALLTEAASKLASGGVITYATCSVFKREDEDVVEAFLASEAGAEFEIEPIAGEAKYFFVNPTVGGPDVHFAARLRRKAQDSSNA
ncbi:MAG: transcription antitermination factor NusB [Coriobacteriia bacterium]|nr:transcription antitermination factor NusB [Coriobacteriia bacterium]